MVENPGSRPARLLIYAAVPDEGMLQQGFYAAEADGLRKHAGVGEVQLTNRLRDVARGDYDGLVSYFYSHSALAAFFARMRQRPVVVTGGAEQIYPALAGSQLRYLVRLFGFQATAVFAYRILATSTSDLARMRDVIWFGRDKVSLSFHGAPALERVGPVPPPFEQRPTGSFITICGLDTPLNVNRKGIPEALRLLARVSAESLLAKLTIIGRATCRDMVEKQAQALGIDDRVHLAGYVTEEEKIALLRQHRYYLQLSVYEGFGIGAMEALSQGCQVIHSGVGGLIDTIADFGILLRRDQIETFALATVPTYAGFADERLPRHLAAFTPDVRAATIMKALFGARPPGQVFAAGGQQR